MQITFLGAGTFGQTLANITTENKHNVKFYDPYKYPDITLESACANSDIFVYVAPSAAADAILPKLPQDTPLICASKGFLSDQPFRRFSDFAAIGGAAFATDFEQHQSQVADQLTLTASSDLAQKLFTTDWLKIEQTSDTKGILLCGALKNIYAYGAGLLGIDSIDLAAFRQDPPAYTKHHRYLRTVSHEIREIFRANHAEPQTFTHYACGLPDLALTCTEESRNFRAGRAVAKNQPIEPTTVEALNILQNIPKDFQLPPSARIFNTIRESYHAE